MITEKDAWFINGYLASVIQIIVVGIAIYSMVSNELIMGLIFIIVSIILWSGFTIIQPNQAVIVQFAGRYVGTYRHEGIVMVIPFSKRRRISLRERIFQSDTILVHDVEGTTISISVVILFKIVDAAKAVFDVENMDRYLSIQSEMSLRSIITAYSYDGLVKDETLLQGVTKELKSDLYVRLHRAGIDLTEIRLIPFINSNNQKMKESIKLTEEVFHLLETEKNIMITEDIRNMIKNKLILPE